MPPGYHHRGRPQLSYPRVQQPAPNFGQILRALVCPLPAIRFASNPYPPPTSRRRMRHHHSDGTTDGQTTDDQISPPPPQTTTTTSGRFSEGGSCVRRHGTAGSHELRNRRRFMPPAHRPRLPNIPLVSPWRGVSVHRWGCNSFRYIKI